MKNDCVFCNFDGRFVLDENAHAFAAYFDCAIKPGHIVVALKDHVTAIADLSPEQAADIMTLAAAVAKKALPLVGCLKFYLVSIADETPHYHLHLLPRMEDDPPIGAHIMGDAGWKGSVGKTVAEEEIAEFIERYKRIS